MSSSLFGVEVNASKPPRKPLSQLIMDLRALSKHTAPSVGTVEELRDHLEAFGKAIATLHGRAVDLIEPKPEPTSEPKRQEKKSKDRQEKGGTDRGDSD